MVLYDITAKCVAEGLMSSLLTKALRNRFTLSQLLRPILPDESTINAISTTVLHSLSETIKVLVYLLQFARVIRRMTNDNVNTTKPTLTISYFTITEKTFAGSFSKGDVDAPRQSGEIDNLLS